MLDVQMLVDEQRLLAEALSIVAPSAGDSSAEALVRLAVDAEGAVELRTGTRERTAVARFKMAAAPASPGVLCVPARVLLDQVRPAQQVLRIRMTEDMPQGRYLHVNFAAVEQGRYRWKQICSQTEDDMAPPVMDPRKLGDATHASVSVHAGALAHGLKVLKTMPRSDINDHANQALLCVDGDQLVGVRTNGHVVVMARMPLKDVQTTSGHAWSTAEGLRIIPLDAALIGRAIPCLAHHKGDASSDVQVWSTDTAVAVGGRTKRGVTWHLAERFLQHHARLQAVWGASRTWVISRDDNGVRVPPLASASLVESLVLVRAGQEAMTDFNSAMVRLSVRDRWLRLYTERDGMVRVDDVLPEPVRAASEAVDGRYLEYGAGVCGAHVVLAFNSPHLWLSSSSSGDDGVSVDVLVMQMKDDMPKDDVPPLIGSADMDAANDDAEISPRARSKVPDFGLPPDDVKAGTAG